MLNRVNNLEITYIGRKIADDDNIDEPFKTKPRRVNIVLDCDSNMKHVILSSLGLSLFMRVPWNEGRFHLLKTMNGDRLWLHYLLRLGLKITVDGFRVFSISDPQTPSSSDFRRPLGVGLEAPDGTYVRILLVDVDDRKKEPDLAMPIDNIINEKYIDKNLSVISFSVPDFMAAVDVKAFSMAVDFVKATRIVRSVLGFDGVTVKADEFGRLGFYVMSPSQGADLRVPGLWKGVLSLVLLAMASSNDIVVVDHVEDMINLQHHRFIADTIIKSKSQWFIGIQSPQLIDYLLHEIPEDVMVYPVFRRDKITIGQLKGEEADQVKLVRRCIPGAVIDVTLNL